jgi:MYXO-CTERM domain-containing protein
VLGTPERCNCMDDDCDGMIDEDAPGAGSFCPGGGRCVACQCRTPCLPGEFPCSIGLVCNSENFCVPPLCGSEICSPSQICQNNRCVDQCAAMTCPAGLVCNVRDGRASCVENTCYGLGCTGNQLCRAGSCVNNGCAQRACPSGQFCRPGAMGEAQCVPTCANTRCPSSQSCVAGACVDDPCRPVRCDIGTICAVVGGRASCQPDPCQNIGAQPGRVCRNGVLVDDPCAGVVCGGGSNVVCRNGQCVDPTLTPLERDRVVGSGGGCAVSPVGSRARSGWWLVAAAMVLSGVRRRRRSLPRGVGGAR